jgi:hypothetical protein
LAIRVFYVARQWQPDGLRSADRYPPLFVEATKSARRELWSVRNPAVFHILKVIRKPVGPYERRR